VGRSLGRLRPPFCTCSSERLFYLNYLAVLPEHQGHGYGRAKVPEAERLLREFGCPKINLQVRASNHQVIDFYHHLGYVVDDAVSMGTRLEHEA
jgi:ribosomal protein S18 acetylase RimI-like enzyme